MTSNSLSSVPNFPKHCVRALPSMYDLSLQLKVAKPMKLTFTAGLQVPCSTACRSDILQNSEKFID